MVIETKTILKGIYRSILKAENVEDCKEALRAVMEAEDVAYVEKIVSKSAESER